LDQAHFSFGAAHKAVGKAVRTAPTKNVTLKDLTSKDWEAAIGKRMNDETMISIRRALDPKRSVYAYRTIGNPDPKRVKQMIRRRIGLVQFLSENNRQAQGEIMRSCNRLGAHHLPS
jgi:argininosuccinate lyase